jgi:hypothetical protein
MLLTIHEPDVRPLDQINHLLAGHAEPSGREAQRRGRSGERREKRSGNQGFARLLALVAPTPGASARPYGSRLEFWRGGCLRPA